MMAIRDQVLQLNQMPQFQWSTEPTALIRSFEVRYNAPDAGALFACDHENVKADMMIIGKALSGGFYPVSAVLADKEVLGFIKSFRYKPDKRLKLEFDPVNLG